MIPVGKRFGRLLTLRLGEPKVYGRKKARTWWCQCDCGVLSNVYEGSLYSGGTRSCGCLKLERARQTKTVHGCYGTPEYKVWNAMIQRCTNPNQKAWKYYGGRGIAVCSRWSYPGGFVRFYSDMGPRPSSQHQIDRIDNNGSYAPENCRWVLRAQQIRNTRKTRMLQHNHRKMSLKEWADEVGAPYSVLWARLSKGWSIKRVLSEPVRFKR